MKFKFNLQLFADEKYLKDNLAGFVPKEVAADIIELTTRGSSVLRLAKVEEMTSDTKQFRVMTEGPGAYWVGETERIKTDKATWIFPEIKAHKIGVIIPVTKEKLNDATIDVFEELKLHIAEAIAKTFDIACLFGTASPFDKNIYGVAHGAGNEIELGTNEALDLDISDTMALVEDSGEDVNGFAASYKMKNRLRKLRNADGDQLYVPGVDQNQLYNNPIEFVRNGGWDDTKAIAIAGNWNYAIVGVRAEIEYEILKEATLQNVTMSDGKPLSLAENDMIAIKATARFGFLPVKEDAFALLIPATETEETSAQTDVSKTDEGKIA